MKFYPQTYYHLYNHTNNREQLFKEKENYSYFLKKYQRNGSLFQPHSKAIHVTDDGYLITLLTYSHQNPLRAGLVSSLEVWSYSSYPDFVGERKETLPDRSIILDLFGSMDTFKVFSENLIVNADKRFWV